MFVSNCAACGKKKPKFIENQETCGFSSSLGISVAVRDQQTHKFG